MSQHESSKRPNSDDMDVGNETVAQLPKKKFYRQRAHSNPIADHCFDYPVSPDKLDWSSLYPQHPTGVVEFADIGCGYGGLLMQLSPMFPDTLMIGNASREQQISSY